MQRIRRLLVLLAAAALLGLPQMALAQQAQEPVVDLMEFIPEQFRADFADRNGDGIPDIGELPPVGIAGIWDDRIGEVTEEGFLAAVSGTFDLGDDGSSLTGPCKGVVISYDADGNSIDAMFDRGGDEPLYDVYGSQTMTRGNPFEVDTRGFIVYYGSSIPETFHNHRWFIMAEGIFKDDGGDPNPRDKNRNAGSVDFGELLPFSFTSIVKAKGAWVDGWGSTELPEVGPYPGMQCVGEGWVKFVGPNPLTTPPGMVALALAAAGFSGVLFNARPALSWREG